MSAPPSPPAPLIRIETLAKRFGSVPALRDVSLDIGDGEFFCLLGPSGCGKSTLLRLLAGFEAPDAGAIRLAGRDLAGVPPQRRPFNMMFQSYALFPHLTVASNVAYGLKRAGYGRGAVAGRVAEMLRLVRLDGKGGRVPAQLSGGERQRVALARALARNPRVLLLDEPLGALDRRLREETGAELKALQARLRTTFVMVTHDQGEALTLADRIAVMDRGRVVQVGRPAEIYGRPATRFVAGFFGTVNIVAGTVDRLEADALLLRTSLRPAPLRVRRPAGAAFLPGGHVEAALRPEAVRLGRPDGPNGLDGEVVTIAFEGATSRLRVRLPDGSLWDVLRPNGADDHPQPGDRVALGFEPAAATVLARDETA